MKIKLLFMLLLLLIISCTNTKNNSLITNHKFIDSLYNTNINYTNTEELFDLVFFQLDDEVTVYPTENYYYYELPLNSKIIAGNIGLSAHKIDEGKIYFAHYEKLDKLSPVSLQVKFGGRYFDENDGVNIKKINDFKYTITYKGKTVIFNLNQININLPKKTKLTKDETFIGPNFDESGIQFFLIYNNATKRFYWILNEENFIPETLIGINENIIIGERTKFAFYNDNKNNRKILIGVYAFNVLNNNWYDGPFDQLPDNYIKTDKIEIKKYIETVYVNARNNIDKYGHFLDNPDSRVAISPYTIYFDAQELIDKLDNCSIFNNSQFYTCITPSENNINPYYYEYLQIPDQEYGESNNKR